MGLAFGGAGFLQVDAHDDFEFVLESIAHGQQLFAILDRGVHVMHRTGTNDHQEPIVFVAENFANPIGKLLMTLKPCPVA